jgi:hypothetical protein
MGRPFIARVKYFFRFSACLRTDRYTRHWRLPGPPGSGHRMWLWDAPAPGSAPRGHRARDHRRPRTAPTLRRKSLDVHLLDYRGIPPECDGRFDGVIAYAANVDGFSVAIEGVPPSRGVFSLPDVRNYSNGEYRVRIRAQPVVSWLSKMLTSFS